MYLSAIGTWFPLCSVQFLLLSLIARLPVCDLLVNLLLLLLQVSSIVALLWSRRRRREGGEEEERGGEKGRRRGKKGRGGGEKKEERKQGGREWGKSREKEREKESYTVKYMLKLWENFYTIAHHWLMWWSQDCHVTQPHPPSPDQGWGHLAQQRGGSWFYQEQSIWLQWQPVPPLIPSACSAACAWDRKNGTGWNFIRRLVGMRTRLVHDAVFDFFCVLRNGVWYWGQNTIQHSPKALYLCSSVPMCIY